MAEQETHFVVIEFRTPARLLVLSKKLNPFERGTPMEGDHIYQQYFLTGVFRERYTTVTTAIAVATVTAVTAAPLQVLSLLSLPSHKVMC